MRLDLSEYTFDRRPACFSVSLSIDLEVEAVGISGVHPELTLMIRDVKSFDFKT